jgi:hypothetical protein
MSLSGTGSDPKRWREWAERTRSIAKQMQTETSRQTMNGIADIYDRVANRTESRTTPPPKPLAERPPLPEAPMRTRGGRRARR